MEGQKSRYRSERITCIPFFIIIIFQFRFVLTSQFYRRLENTFQSIIYNEYDGPHFYGNSRKVVKQIPFVCMAYSWFHTAAVSASAERWFYTNTIRYMSLALINMHCVVHPKYSDRLTLKQKKTKKQCTLIRLRVLWSLIWMYTVCPSVLDK